MAYWPGMVLLVADAAALAWAGMWLGLKCKGRIRAILGSLTLVLFVPWLMTQMMMALWTISRDSPRRTYDGLHWRLRGHVGSLPC